MISFNLKRAKITLNWRTLTKTIAYDLLMTSCGFGKHVSLKLLIKCNSAIKGS